MCHLCVKHFGSRSGPNSVGIKPVTIFREFAVPWVKSTRPQTLVWQVYMSQPYSSEILVIPWFPH